MRVVLVSRNEHKLRELRSLLPGWELELLGAGALPEEVGETYHENARAKALFGRTVGAPSAWMLGEDSGLEVDGLGGRPGVRSARFAGPGATDADNVAALLRALRGVEGDGRRARYVCELVFVSPAGAETGGRGVLTGSIAPAPAGAGGFGYDPVFVPEGESSTVAELGDAWKQANSHRARAAGVLRAAVGARGEAL